MANMSYCRFENTHCDLRDCYSAMVNEDPISEEEEKWRKRLIDLCIDIAQEFGGLQPEDIGSESA
jgi:hypothetical protein